MRGYLCIYVGNVYPLGTINRENARGIQVRGKRKKKEKERVKDSAASMHFRHIKDSEGRITPTTRQEKEKKSMRANNGRSIWADNRSREQR